MSPRRIAFVPVVCALGSCSSGDGSIGYFELAATVIEQLRVGSNPTLDPGSRISFREGSLNGAASRFRGREDAEFLLIMPHSGELDYNGWVLDYAMVDEDNGYVLVGPDAATMNDIIDIIDIIDLAGDETSDHWSAAPIGSRT